MASILILGAGRIGTTVGRALKRNGHRVSFWDVVPGRVKRQKPLDKIVPSASLVLLCVPSWVTRECILSFRDLLRPNAVVLSFAKGIESSTGKTVDRILTELLPKHATGLIGGPMMAEEIEKKKSGVAVIAMNDRRAFRTVAALFDSSAFHIDSSSDVHGVAIAGVLKNIYAFCLGIVEGAGWGMNLRGWLTSKAISEMLAISDTLKASPGTTLGTAGAGDMIATAYSPFSRNRRIGKELIRTRKVARTEATVSIEPLCRLLGRKSESFKILSGLRSIVNRKTSPNAVLAEWRENASTGG